jgi:hypothetical protein
VLAAKARLLSSTLTPPVGAPGPVGAALARTGKTSRESRVEISGEFAPG